MRQLIEPADPLEWHRTGSVKPACTADACHQGRRSCPTPQACALPDDDRPAGSARGLVLTLFALAVALASVVYQLWPQIVAFFLEIL